MPQQGQYPAMPSSTNTFGRQVDKGGATQPLQIAKSNSNPSRVGMAE
jgi:hypothetical protein